MKIIDTLKRMVANSGLNGAVTEANESAFF
jgi:hypothetical protein